jgi:hypothetical protein
MQQKLRLCATAFALILFVFTSAFAFGQATVTTDLPDYPPGSTVIITGSGFLAGESVKLQVLHYDINGDNDASAAHQPWYVTADADGNISSTWLVPLDEDEFGATLFLTADGQDPTLPARHAETTFTDASEYPSGIALSAGSTSPQTRCVGISANTLTANLATCGNGSKANISYKWYYNTTNSSSIVGATLVQTTNTNTNTLSTTFTPSTTSADVGTRFYFCQVTQTDPLTGSGCGSVASFTTATVKVTVN